MRRPASASRTGVWPCARVEERSEYDPETQTLEEQPPVIEESRVVYAWTPRALTLQERLLRMRAQRADALLRAARQVADQHARRDDG